MMGMMPIPLSTRVTWETTTLELVCEEKQAEVTLPPYLVNVPMSHWAG